MHAIIFYRAEGNAWTTVKNFVILNRSRWDVRYGDTLSFIATQPGGAGALLAHKNGYTSISDNHDYLKDKPHFNDKVAAA